MSIKSEAKTKKLGVAGWKVGQTWHRNNCSHAKKYNQNRETLLAKQIFSPLILNRQLKFMLQHPTVWLDRKQLKYLSKELLLYDFFAQEVDWCMKDCDKQRLQTTVSINLWKILAGHTGDWFDVKTASICTTELWDALKSFILSSLKFKVAPYPIIVSLDTLRRSKIAMFGPIFWKMEHGYPPILFHFLTACAINNRFWQKIGTFCSTQNCPEPP